MKRVSSRWPDIDPDLDFLTRVIRHCRSVLLPVVAVYDIIAVDTLLLLVAVARLTTLYRPRILRPMHRAVSDGRTNHAAGDRRCVFAVAAAELVPDNTADDRRRCSGNDETYIGCLPTIMSRRNCYDSPANFPAVSASGGRLRFGNS